MNKTLTLSVVPGVQNGSRIFAGLAEAGALINFTTVDHYKSPAAPDDPSQGYQRPPERSRITRIGSFLIKHILESTEADGGFFPTAVLLASRKPIHFNATNKSITLRLDQPLQIIDGQHRIAGLRYAIEEKGKNDLSTFSIPFVIVETPDRIIEMNQFRIINGTAKSVRTDLVNAILTATVAKHGDSAVKDSERWKVVVTRVVDRLDKDPGSPWAGLILMPDEAGSPKSNNGKITRATSFMTSLRPVYQWLKELQFLDKCGSINEEADRVYEVVASFWRAVQQAVPDPFSDPGEYVIQRTPGLFSLHKLLVGYLLPVMWQGRRQWSTENFLAFVKESPEITDPMFWHSKESRASAFGSMKGFEELYQLLRDSVEPKP